jgi:hypothetical protein
MVTTFSPTIARQRCHYAIANTSTGKYLAAACDEVDRLRALLGDRVRECERLQRKYANLKRRKAQANA